MSLNAHGALPKGAVWAYLPKQPDIPKAHWDGYGMELKVLSNWLSLCYLYIQLYGYYKTSNWHMIGLCGWLSLCLAWASCFLHCFRPQCNKLPPKQAILSILLQLPQLLQQLLLILSNLYRRKLIILSHSRSLLKHHCKNIPIGQELCLRRWSIQSQSRQIWVAWLLSLNLSKI